MNDPRNNNTPWPAFISGMAYTVVISWLFWMFFYGHLYGTRCLGITWPATVTP